eukprot:1589586-Amphidinium_carterae.1
MILDVAKVLLPYMAQTTQSPWTTCFTPHDCDALTNSLGSLSVITNYSPILLQAERSAGPLQRVRLQRGRPPLLRLLARPNHQDSHSVTAIEGAPLISNIPAGQLVAKHELTGLWDAEDKKTKYETPVCKVATAVHGHVCKD